VIAVLVVGAGPTGLTLACDLARRGVPVRIIDRMPEFPTGSRGKALQPRSLEVFDDLGVIDEILASGNPNLMFRHYVRGRVIREVDPQPGVAPSSDKPYPRGLFIPQWRVEQVLRDRLAELGVRVELGSELAELSQTDGAVTATVVKDGGSERIEVDYLVACDGGKSRIRKLVGARFDGATHDTLQLLCGDVEVEGLPPDAWHQWFTDGQLVMLCPLPGTDSWQFQATPLGDKGPSLKTFQRIVDARTGMDIRLRNPTWLSTYRINVRMVDRLRVGRVFLAGDAAHVHPIAGGLGMNTGIQDAYNLGWKLATNSSELLDTYQEERLPIAAWTLQTSSTAGERAARGIRTGAGGVELVISDGTSQLGLHYRFSSLSRDLIDRTDRLCAGDRAPDAPLQTVDGSPARVFDAFRGPRFTLLGFGAGCAGALRELAGWVPTYDVTGSAEAYASYGIEPHQDTLVLVRPDGYVGLTAAGDNAGGVRDYLATLTG
jgi:2-polyprenyl-6-methoxyphenol hydroxylase-like FAD-dependent oxidoreductase